ncbi:DNA alkylation repair protein [Rathayibacter sp. VKM Ac-2803]|nr:DNA alkylation repair protein [Rathayibacter sp. VKM Ac-2803]MWV50291.1 DNA alkylation repair protein [Rathayibacter sp. VKM Ac-2803]
MSDAGDFVRAALEYEGDVWRAQDVRDRLGLDATGASVGAVRGTVRDALKKFPDLGHDEITALSSELWAPPVFEPRLAAVVLLQSRVALLRASDLTRLEGFVRDSRVDSLTDPLARDVVRPLRESLDSQARTRADAVLDRWAAEGDRLARAEGIVRR